MLARLDWVVSQPLIEAATGLWLTGHALPVLAFAAFLLLAAVAAPRAMRAAVPRILPTRVAAVRTLPVTALPCSPQAPPLRGAVAARAPGRVSRALSTSL